VKARYPGRCPVCCRPIAVGQELGRRETYWAHRECAEAARADGRARTRILEGVEFAGRKPSTWRRGKSPSPGASRRYTGGRKRGYTRGIRKIA
jgi:hypothetical protein